LTRASTSPRISGARFALLALFAACAAASCASRSPWREAASGVKNKDLARLCADAWEFQMSSSPVWATNLGDPRYNAELSDNSRDGEAMVAEKERELLHRARAIPTEELADGDRVTLELLIERWQQSLAEYDSDIDVASWSLDPRGGPQTEFLNLASDQPLTTGKNRDDALARWWSIPLYIDRCRDNLRRGAANGRTAPKKAVSDVIAQIDKLLATPVDQSPLSLEARAKEIDAAAYERFFASVRSTVELAIYPAFRRYRAELAGDVLPRARDDEHPGLKYLPGGDAYYRQCIARETSLEMTPQEIHEFGLAEVARVRAEISALGAKVFSISDIAAIQKKLRDDPALHFKTADEVRQKAADTLARAEAAVPHAFGIRPKMRCEVFDIPDFEAPYTTIAYYREGSADGKRPGRYCINVYQPETRPKYEAEVLAFHESVPGHHLQIAIAHELDDLPLVRRHNECTAFVEGWALYCERLADELGLYSSDVDRLGMLSYDAWRSCRLVVDTGLHSEGWSRERAIDYMLENTLLAKNNIENEVDRYIATPGQALAYKLGQREIFALRKEAQARLGSRFSLSEFHDRVLENGPVTLKVLRESIERWLDRSAPDASSPGQASAVAPRN
jgi:uncharacterized protein (DUF885 family)